MILPHTSFPHLPRLLLDGLLDIHDSWASVETELNFVFIDESLTGIRFEEVSLAFVLLDHPLGCGVLSAL